MSLPRSLAAALRSWLILGLVLLGFSLHPAFRNTFWTAAYLPNIFQQAATNIILAVGMTCVILTGGIDLSVGSVMALCGIALGLNVTTGPPPFIAALMAFPAAVLIAVLAVRPLVQRQAPTATVYGTGAAVALIATALGAFLVVQGTRGGVKLEGALVAALLVGAACGLINGLVVSLGRVPAFVATLGMYTAARDLAVYATGGNSVSGLPPRFAALGSWNNGLGLVLIALGVVVLGAIFQTQTRSGRYLGSIGANEEASRLSGVPVVLHKTLAYVLAGLIAGIAAIVLTAKFALADTGAGTGAELNAIAAVVIGGTSLSGGRGSVVGSLVGALTIAVLNSGLVLIGVEGTLQGVIIGAVIVLAVLVDQLGKRVR